MPFKKKKKKVKNTDDKLDKILHHLEAMDKRDRMRMWGGFIKGVIGLVPAIAFIYFGWYFYHHGDEVMEKIARTAAQQAAEVTKMGTEGILDQFDTEGLMEQFKNFQIK